MREGLASTLMAYRVAVTVTVTVTPEQARTRDAWRGLLDLW
jgi:hypothetical protein